MNDGLATEVSHNGNLHLAKSQREQAPISYRQAIQQVFGDVSDALIGYEKLRQVRTRQEDTLADLQETGRISTLRHKGGTTTYLEVLDGQRSLFGAELTLAAARGDEYRSLVQLYKALGWRLAIVKLLARLRGVIPRSRLRTGLFSA